MGFVRQLSSYLFIGLFIISVLAQLLDTYKSSDFIERNFIISSNRLLFITIISALLLRIKDIFPISTKTLKFLSFTVTPVLFLGVISLIITEQITYDNFIYNLFSIHIEQVFILALFCLSISMIFQPSAVLRKQFKFICFYSSLGLLLGFYLYGFVPFSAQKILVHEDGFIEYLQVIVLLIASLYSFRIALIFLRKRSLFPSVVFFLSSITLFIVAGDEISWAQRILNIPTPESLMESNTQGEITIHNQYKYTGYVPLAYTLIGLYGSIAWIPYFFLKKESRNSFFQYFVPRWFLFFYFFPPFLYNFYLRFGIVPGFWAEMFEFMLYLGAFLHILYVFLSLKQKKLLRINQ